MVTAGPETPDAIGFKSFESILIEVKVSRGDFLRDAKKRHRQDGEGMGDLRYYMAPAGMIKSEEVPAGWGLLEVIEGRVRERLEAPRRKARKDHEVALLVSALRRIGQAPPPGISVKCYTIETERRATISIAPEIHPAQGSPK
jgi:hypothetical protein